MATRFTALRLAVGTLTVIPVGAIGPIDRRTAGRAMLLAPLAVLPIAVLAGLIVEAGTWLGWPGSVYGLLVVGALALGTRAMHLDGLADTVDGLGSGWDRERALTIMRTGDVGPMGVVALIIVLSLQSSLFGLTDPLTAAAAIVVSRAALVVVCVRGVPAARPDGLGATVAGSVAPVAAVVTGLGAAALLLLVDRTWVGPVAVVVAALIVLGLVRHCVRRLGGVSGDVMGASIEVALTVLLLVVAAS